MLLLSIVIISISLGIWKYPFIKYHAMKIGEVSVGCDRCEDCKFCMFAVMGTITAIVTVPLMVLWIYVLKPIGIKIFQWQKERTELYKKMMEDDK